jgi:hypothetical protein
MLTLRDRIIILAIIMVLAIAASIIAIQRIEGEQRSREERMAHSSHSPQSRGVLALKSWLDAAGYHTRQIENEAFHVSADTGGLIILTPEIPFSDEHVAEIVNWVERGNTLIVAEKFTLGSDKLLQRLKVKLNQSTRYQLNTPLEQPVSGAPRGERITVDTSTSLTLTRDDYVTYLSTDNKPLLVSFPQGKGRVWFSSAPDLFNNENLLDDPNAALVLAMLSSVPRGGSIAFDEYHLGLTGADGESARGTPNYLTTTPWGWAILSAFLIGFAYLLINGKRFGRVVPLPQDILRRSPAEYVTSMANLYRRAGKRKLIAQHYHRQLKRALGKPYQINVNLPDEEFVDELARYRDSFDRDALLKILRALKKNPDERSLVKLAEQAIQFTAR